MSIVLKGMRINLPLDDKTAMISLDHHPASTIISYDSKSVICEKIIEKLCNSKDL
jgi:hypothetical protein